MLNFKIPQRNFYRRGKSIGTAQYEKEMSFVEDTKFRHTDLTNGIKAQIENLAQWTCCRGWNEAEAELMRILELLETTIEQEEANK